MNVSRRRYMGEKGGSIPYQRIEYLESDGNSYIDTQIAFTDGFSWEVKFSNLISYYGNIVHVLFGGRTSTIRTTILFKSNNLDYGAVVNIAGYQDSTTPFRIGNISNGEHIIKFSASGNYGNLWLDNELVYNNVRFYGQYISGTTMSVFADHFGGSDYREISKDAKLYYLKLWQGQTLVGDFIPVRIGTTGYLYDQVSGELFGNLGSGNFILGPDIN